MANRTVMHVDDDPQVTRLVAAKLKAAGYEVISLNDPTDVLERLLDCDCPVVILDMDMPGIGGLDLLREIKRQDGGVLVIMLTGVVTMSSVLRSLRWGAEACVFKPLTDYEPLLSAVEAAFAKIDRWWESLQELKRRKAAEQPAMPVTAATPTQ